MVSLRVGPGHRARPAMIPAPCIAEWKVGLVVHQPRLRAAQLAGRVEDVPDSRTPGKVHGIPLRCLILSSVTPTQSPKTQYLHEECDHPRSCLVMSWQVALHRQAVNMAQHSTPQVAGHG